MKRISVMGCVCVALALGQVATVSAQNNRGAPTEPKPTVKRTQMYEDIEIFRRLLQRKLNESLGVLAANRSAPSTRAPYENSEAGPQGLLYLQHMQNVPAQGYQVATVRVEGVYLQGRGAVFTVTMPTLPEQTQAPSGTPDKQDSDWERERRRLRGNDVAEPRALVARPSVSDVVLKLLASTGKHFSQLPESESVTVAITFRDGQAGANQQWQYGVHFTPAVVENIHSAMARRTEALGDLHLKNAKMAEAVKAYEEALKLEPQSEELMRKLIQVQLKQGNDQRAQELLKVLLGKEYGPAPAKASNLPARLIITASKKLLDEVGEGKITFEQFKKAASVEHLTFPNQPTP